ncbi:putative NADH dehydrogenase/NAD(P)H nitroreductase [Candidatus Rhodobacter oscarellae]|uniref:Putative NADH dehydrogenase/NAD(P)H nitroreductase n=1 Tax=Candidatus Rhodobacter oscarellae TaxID=1675527 RepID=A0A0J9EF16_9RHOB|nr:nitroreductase family protein [Candidatus Rhodobacter lobularis]KMW60274.1 putative NADH dehydrogenase/NAD(P)H nitroreductase [Candidatus Rhodobacter lobularis]
MRDSNPLASNARYDYERYAKHSFVDGGTTREHRRAILRILTHYIEGGMSFPDVRLGYGQEKITSILSKLDGYMSEFGVDETVEWALSTITSYLEFHAARDMPQPEIAARLEKAIAQAAYTPKAQAGGAEEVTKAQIEEAVDFDYRRFLLTRHSVRQYTDEPLDDATIRKIVANAQECSNVCNRQTIKVYAFNDYGTVQDLLTYQAGNAGFRPEIRTLFIITANMEHMNLIGERYQGWIDGGIFAQTLALSIHAEGLGGCFLNWSVEMEQDMALRARVGIPESELVITFISAGHLKDRFNVPVSARKPVEQVLSLNPPLV